MAILVKDDNGDFVPQHLSPDGTVYYKTKGNQFGGQYITPINNNGVELFTDANPGKVNAQLTGSSLQEQKTNADAVNGVVTFGDVIKHIEIYNKDTVNEGNFTVNGIKIIVPAGKVFEAPIGGTPGSTVTVTGSTSYILGRYA